MSHAGDFPPAARATILERSMGRCAGCGTSSGLTIQHRRARRMGGTSNTAIAHPANGLALCGSGTTGCHGWAEAHPTAAALLGWRLEPGDDPTEAPYWDHVWSSWRRATPEGSHEYVEPNDLDHRAERESAVAARRLTHIRPLTPTPAHYEDEGAAALLRWMPPLGAAGQPAARRP